MLNEYREYDDYTSKLGLKVNSDKPNFTDAEIYGRLLKVTLTLYHGIERALVIIARRYLFHDLNDIHTKIPLTKENNDQRIDLAMRAMNLWCSYETLDDQSFKDLIGKYGHGRFYDYMLDAKNAFQNILNRIEKGEIERGKAKIKDYISTKNKLETSLSDWEMKYVPQVLSKTFYSNNSELKAKYSNRIITFDTIIADAIYQGPLQNHSVAISHDFFPYISSCFDEKFKAYMFDFAITTALYVVDKTKNDNEYQIINTSYMANWLHKKNFDRSFKKFNLKLSDRDLFAEDIIFNVTKKVYIDEEITQFFRIIDETNPIKENEFMITDDIELKDLKKAFKVLYEQSKVQKNTNPK